MHLSNTYVTQRLLIFDDIFILCRWEKYDAKGWTEKGAHKYGRLNEQSWWEKWGEHYDGQGYVLKWYLIFLLIFSSTAIPSVGRCTLCKSCHFE